MRRLAMKRGRASWGEAAIAAGVAVVLVLAVRWLLEPALLVEAVVGALAYGFVLLVLIGRRQEATTRD